MSIFQTLSAHTNLWYLMYCLQDNDYVRLARHSAEVLWAYLHSPEAEWKLEKGSSVEEGLVHSKKVQGVGKVFRLKVRGQDSQSFMRMPVKTTEVIAAIIAMTILIILKWIRQVSSIYIPRNVPICLF